MNVLNLRGRPAKLNVIKYRIDWDHEVSGPQKVVKDFLHPYWENDLVLEECRIPNSLLRIDLLNLSRSIVVEVSPPKVHATFNPFFHGSLAGYRASIGRDLDKVRFAELNKLTYVEIDDPSTQLNAAWFRDTHGVTL